MIKLSERAIFSLILTAFVGILFYLTFQLSPTARLAAMTVVVPTFLLLVFQSALDLAPKLERAYKRFDKADPFKVEPIMEKSPTKKSADSSKSADDASLTRRELNLFFWISLLLASVYLFGFLIGLPAYSLLYLRRRSEESWKLSIAIAAGIGGLLYGVFILVFRVRLYEGFLWN